MSHLLFQLKNASLWRWASQMFCTWTLKVRRVLPSAHIIASHCPSHTDKGRDVAILILKEHHLKPSILTQSSPLSSKGGGGNLQSLFQKTWCSSPFLVFLKSFSWLKSPSCAIRFLFPLYTCLYLGGFFWQCLGYFYNQKEKDCIFFYFFNQLNTNSAITSWDISRPL